jgi:hypothetical protein
VNQKNQNKSLKFKKEEKNMRITKTAVFLASLLVLFLSVSLLAAPEKEIQKTFAPKEELKLKFALGDCRIEKSSDGQIHVHLVYSYEDSEAFEPRLEERARAIYLEEKFHRNNPQGYSKWTVAVPDNTEINFNSGTGDLTISGSTAKIDGNTGTGDIQADNTKGKFKLNSGTGDVDVHGSEGEFKLNSGTGRVRIENSNGNFNANSGTGDVKAHGLTIEYEGNFNSGTGDVEVSFPKGEDFDLTASSGTGDAVVNMQGQPIQGYFEFTAQARRGRIVSPVKFDKEEEYMERDNKYLLKSFTKGKKSPRVYIKTGTGTAKLKD